jgi:hypothetical protein
VAEESYKLTMLRKEKGVLKDTVKESRLKETESQNS